MVHNYQPAKDVIVTTSGKVLGGVLRALSEMPPSARTEMLSTLRLSSDDNPAPPPTFAEMRAHLTEKGILR